MPMVRERRDVWQLRWLLLASGLCSTGAVVVVAVFGGHPWSWPLFTWGALLGVVLGVVVDVVARHYRKGNTEVDQWRRRRLLNFTILIWSGALIGGLAAGLDAIIVDAIATAYVVVSQSRAWLALSRADRQQEIGQSS